MFLKKLFSKKKKKPTHWTAEQFWIWFVAKQDGFYKRIKKSDDETPIVLDEILEEVQKFHSGIYGLIGFYEPNVLEFVFTSDGEIKNFVFIDELVAKAPKLSNWKFTRLKPKITHFDPAIHTNDLVFSKEKLSFYTVDDPEYPDEIDIVLLHEDYVKEEDHRAVMNGCLLYLDNCLGELDFATKIDYIDLKRKEEMPKGTETIPIEKLSDYVLWREKEFLQRYESTDTPLPENEKSNLLEAEVDGYPLFAVVSTCWREWPYKPFYCWAVKLVIHYKGQENGLPSKEQLELIQEYESRFIDSLSFLPICHVGRTTHQHESTVYLYTNEYNQVSRSISQFLADTASESFEVTYHIYRDKYWRNVGRFL